LDKELNSILKEKDVLDLRNKIKKVCIDGVSGGKLNTRILLVAATLLTILTMGYSVNYLFGRMKSHESQKSDNTWIYSEFGDWNKTFFPFQNLKEEDIFFGEQLPNSHNHYGKNVIQKDLLALYQPNKSLEYLVGSLYRSIGFSLKTPVRFARYNRNETLLFSWKMENPAQTRLTIVDNRGEIRYESDYNQYQAVQIKASYLGPGLFYYKILNKDEVICFGKFTVQY
jgi:hypothetical protein